MSSNFENVFQLLDSRGFGKLNLESIFEFVSAIPLPPQLTEVTQLYQDFDEDGSGDIDMEEFPGLCKALEKLTKQSADDMLTYFIRRQYEHLFELADEDGGGSISSSELKILVDSLQTMLNLKTSATEVALILKDFGRDELDFDDFYEIMQKLMEGRSIVQVVRAFEEAQKRARARTMDAKSKLESFVRFQNAPSPAAEASPKSFTRARSKTLTCASCIKKDQEIQTLRERVADLEEQLSKYANAKPPAEHNEPRMRNGLRNVENAVPAYKSFPSLLSSAIFQSSSARVSKVLQNMVEWNSQTPGKEIVGAADAAHKAQRQVGAVLVQPSESVRKLLDIFQEFLLEFELGKTSSKMMDRFLIQSGAVRLELESHAQSLQWVVDSVVQARTNLCQCAMSSLPFAPNGQKLAEVILTAEQVTQKLSETQNVLLFYCSPNLTEIEILMQAIADNQVEKPSDSMIEDMKSYITKDKERFSSSNIQTMVSSLKESVYAIQAGGTVFSPTIKRDRGVNTVGGGDALITVSRKVPIQSKKRHHDPSEKPLEEMRNKGLMFSRPPRVREILVERDRRVGTVDALIARYLRSGVEVPSNFGRLYSHNLEEAAKKHIFTFGTRTIHLLVIEDHLAVQVGGGYMYFDEYCATYTEQEVGRAQRQFRSRSRSPQPEFSSAQANTVFTGGLRSSSRMTTSPPPMIVVKSSSVQRAASPLPQVPEN